MLNDILNLLKNRKSVRLFEDRSIPQYIKDEILDAAFQAPTAGAMMLYTILDITDQGLKEKLAIACDNQPFIAKAPLVLIFLADYQRWYDSFAYNGCEPRLPGEGDLLLSYSDTLIAAQNTVTAAEAMGLGSCYIGDIIENCEIVRELLNLPDFAIPAAMVVYGYPASGQRERRKPARFDRKYIVFENKYRRLMSDEHAAMHLERNKLSGAPVTEDIRAFCLRKYMSAFAIEMNRSASEYIKKYR